jgi:hypothetical protein
MKQAFPRPEPVKRMDFHSVQLRGILMAIRKMRMMMAWITCLDEELHWTRELTFGKK